MRGTGDNDSTAAGAGHLPPSGLGSTVFPSFFAFCAFFLFFLRCFFPTTFGLRVTRKFLPAFQ